ncbi:hypothetical protein BCR43DRAFT_526710 [Syncephalastrum racemosum]|uniref:Glutathione S-transferase n=1 Tax=Syncephalastrum racemosum TaxID=13706 RepID=A0A1X2H3X2_SYNRA|nr:hypothetical protein BCR43DRAFT_526710 [Syncephalastrum racemosum]
MSNLKLYTFPPSLWASVPRLLIAEKHIKDIEYATIDLSKAENFSPSYLEINPNHTVPALEITDKNGRKTFLDDSIQVCDYLDQVSGEPRLYRADKSADIDAYLNEMHGKADVGNPLFFTSKDDAELAGKKGTIVPFLEGRIEGWRKYKQEAPQHQQLYDQNIQATQAMIDAYTGKADPKNMYETSRQCWAAAEAFMDKSEQILGRSSGEWLFGEYSLADVHLTSYMFRMLLVKKPEEVFEGRPKLKAYYERVQKRSSFAATFS